MKVTVDCIPCYIEQAIRAMNQLDIEDTEQRKYIHQLLTMIPSLDPNKSPAENSSLILHKLVEALGGRDPFFKAKKESNKIALKYYPKLREIVKKSDDSLYTSIKLSVAGNVVDLGLFEDYDLGKAVDDSLKVDFAINDYNSFKNLLSLSTDILIIGDNSGEIVFDLLLLEELSHFGKNLYYGVKSGFIINDATYEDAMEAGTEKFARVVENGNNFLGTVEDKCSREFLGIFSMVGLVISKGQANYESLEGTELAGDKTFFLLKAKCPVVARHLGVDYGDIIFKRNKHKN